MRKWAAMIWILGARPASAAVPAPPMELLENLDFFREMELVEEKEIAERPEAVPPAEDPAPGAPEPGEERK